MILLDYSQIANAGAVVNFINNGWIELDLFRNQLLNTIRNLKITHKAYGELVICLDDDNGYWRKEIFPFYKSNRRKDVNIDWAAVSNAIKTLKGEIIENLPYKAIQVKHAEADDVIGCLCEKYGDEGPLSVSERILIVSGDRDFYQLHKYPNVDQYDPINKISLSCQNPELSLKEKILKGDTGDGIPNFLSPDNSFVAKIRQKPLTKKKIEEYITKNDPALFCDETTSKYYQRNKILIDLSNTPDIIRTAIVESYDQQATESVNREKLLLYFINANLRELSKNINDF